MWFYWTCGLKFTYIHTIRTRPMNLNMLFIYLKCDINCCLFRNMIYIGMPYVWICYVIFLSLFHFQFGIHWINNNHVLLCSSSQMWTKSLNLYNIVLTQCWIISIRNQIDLIPIKSHRFLLYSTQNQIWQMGLNLSRLGVMLCTWHETKPI